MQTKILKILNDLGFGSFQTNEGEVLWDGLEGEGATLIGPNRNYAIVKIIRDYKGKIIQFEVEA